MPTLILMNLSACLSLETLSSYMVCCSYGAKPHASLIMSPTNLMCLVRHQQHQLGLSLLTFFVTLWPLLKPMAMGLHRAMAAALQWPQRQEAVNDIYIGWVTDFCVHVYE